ncbi:MAG: sigma-54-dependent Fis family transcriptional regulator [Ignavibacteria bacterium]|nr:sigma-54-dependent Fis family transcriptional regulator [Ignavibacteria bacterium]
MHTAPFHILLIDDERAQRESLAGFLRKQSYDVTEAASGTEGLRALRAAAVDLILTDLRMPDISGEDVLRGARELHPLVPVIVMTAYASIESAVGLMKLGAFDYVQKPVELDELLLLVERARERSLLLSENAMLRAQLAERFSFDTIVSQSGEMDAVLNTAGRVARSKASVLIRGESGTGKELIARAIHHASPRRDAPFVTVNCAALPDALLESELFGHEKGAFTGAERQRIGRFEQADGGTLFIDEVGDIPLAAQVKLLRALQFGEIERVGGSETLALDVRIVAATNRDLEAMMRDGSFREDLYYRLNVVGIHIPPLRARRADIPPLVDAFVRRHAEANGREALPVSREAMDLLLRHDYPGNVRELDNILQHAVVLARAGTITTQDLPGSVRSPRGSGGRSDGGISAEPGNLNERVELLERRMIEGALQLSSGNQVRAAELLGISERTLRYKLAKLEEQASKPDASTRPA